MGRFTFEFESLAWISNPLNNQNFLHIVCTSTIQCPSIQIQNVQNIMDRTWEKDQTKIMYTWMTERWENYNGKVAGLNFCIVNVPSLFAKRDNSIGTCIHYLCSALKLHDFTFPVLRIATSTFTISHTFFRILSQEIFGKLTAKRISEKKSFLFS